MKTDVNCRKTSWRSEVKQNRKNPIINGYTINGADQKCCFIQRLLNWNASSDNSALSLSSLFILLNMIHRSMNRESKINNSQFNNIYLIITVYFYGSELIMQLLLYKDSVREIPKSHDITRHDAFMDLWMIKRVIWMSFTYTVLHSTFIINDDRYIE